MHLSALFCDVNVCLAAVYVVLLAANDTLALHVAQRNADRGGLELGKVYKLELGHAVLLHQRLHNMAVGGTHSDCL